MTRSAYLYRGGILGRKLDKLRKLYGDASAYKACFVMIYIYVCSPGTAISQLTICNACSNKRKTQNICVEPEVLNNQNFET